MAINTVDRSNNPITLNTNTPTSSQHVGTATPTDAGTGAFASVASVVGAANAAPPGSNNNGLQVGAIPLLYNPAGNLDHLRGAAADLLPSRGIQPTLLMLGTRYTGTSTTTVSSGSTTATLSMAVTAGFVVGGICNFEPGTSRYPDQAVITGVVANTSVTVAFPSGGAAATHTANYTIETYAPSVVREAPGRQGALLVSADGTKPTYRAGQTGQTLYSTAAAVLVEVVGSATKTIRVKSITIWGQAGTKFFTELQLLRCTAASAGSASAANKGKHDTNDASGTAVINYYTAAAAAGSGNAIIGAKPLS